jgi:cation transport ATPase
MKYLSLLLASSLLLSTPALADHIGGDKGHEVITAGINGLVCDFCAQAMENTFGSQPAVEKVSVDLTAKTLTLRLKPDQKFSDEEVRKNVTDAGYDTVTVERKSM